MRRSWRGSSTLDGRCRVTRTYASRSRPAASHGRRASARRLEAPQRVDHRVADEAHAAAVDALGGQVRGCLGAVGEEEIGHPVGEDAVDLLGHGPVERAQAGLDVGHGDAELGGGERGGERRVDVAAHAARGRAGPRAAAPRRPRARVRSGRRASPSPRRGRRRARGSPGRRASPPTSGRRSAARCGRCAGATSARCPSAAMTGAILTKFGRAPTTWTTVPEGMRRAPKQIDLARGSAGHEQFRHASERPLRRAGTAPRMLSAVWRIGAAGCRGTGRIMARPCRPSPPWMTLSPAGASPPRSRSATSAARSRLPRPGPLRRPVVGLAAGGSSAGAGAARRSCRRTRDRPSTCGGSTAAALR